MHISTVNISEMMPDKENITLSMKNKHKHNNDDGNDDDNNEINNNNNNNNYNNNDNRYILTELVEIDLKG